MRPEISGRMFFITILAHFILCAEPSVKPHSRLLSGINPFASSLFRRLRVVKTILNRFYLLTRGGAPKGYMVFALYGQKNASFGAQVLIEQATDSEFATCRSYTTSDARYRMRGMQWVRHRSFQGDINGKIRRYFNLYRP